MFKLKTNNNKITFCLLTCGEETESDCLKAIKSFRDKIVFQEVRNVFPQLKALNQMIEQCHTEYLVPLDSDIILNNDAFDRIEKSLVEHQNDAIWHSILFPLFDTLTEEKILALKVMRTKILKRFPFMESPTPDIEHYDRLKFAGFTAITTYLDEDPIGNHVVKGMWFCYNKYKDIYLTLRSYNWTWDQNAFKGGNTLKEKAKKHFDYFFEKWVVTNNDDYLYCIAGMADGLTMDLEYKSKNLKKKKLRVKKKEAIEVFFKWFLKDD